MLAQGDYNFQNYRDRLELSDSAMIDILEREILVNADGLTSVGEAFYSYWNIATDSDIANTSKFKIKIMRDFGLDRLVYESMRDSDAKNQPLKIERLILQIPEDHEIFLSEIRKANRDNIDGLSFTYRIPVSVEDIERQITAAAKLA